MPVAAASRVVAVSVHARGALVTRAVTLPSDLPRGAVDLTVAALTPLADPGSLRAEISGGRQVVSVTSVLRYAAGVVKAGPSVEKVAELTRMLARLDAERAVIEERLKMLRALTPVPKGRFRKEGAAVDSRFADALAAAQLVDSLTAQLDARAAEIDTRSRALRHQLDAASLDDAQRASAERMGHNHPTREVTVRLEGDARIDTLSLCYVVPAARWWPTYTLRLSEGGTRASWWLEALVAQLSGEDWTGAQLSLATASLVADARLPELPSLRWGRAQAKPRRAYRPAPAGLERMFEPYDRAFAPLPPPPRGLPPPAPPRVPMPEPFAASASMVAPAMAAAPAPMMASVAPSPSRAMAKPAPPGAAAGGGMDMARSRSKKAASEPLGGASFGAADRDGSEAEASFDEAGPSGSPPSPSSIEPTDAWLDFDSLAMAPVGDSRRGRLTLRSAPTLPRELLQAASRIDALTPQNMVDPLESRGLFDHRYEVAGATSIPSDGALHRITVAIGEAPSALRWRTVPREAAEVYKETRLTNPFASPLLAGPVDVFVDGSLLTTSAIDRIDIGGEMTVGLGVEDRIRVARNARVEESSAGLLGGSIVVDSEVTIDLTSSLAKEALVEVIDRIPISDDDDLGVELVSSKPASAPYTQEERGAPVRHGLRWSLPLPPSGKSSIVYRYKLSFSGKSEIVGGNRRE